MDSRIVGIVGAVLLIAGAFCPIVGVDFLGRTATVSFLGSAFGTSWEGVVILLCGIAAVVLAVLKKNRFLLIPGVLALAVVAYTYLTFKSKMMEGFASAGAPESIRQRFSDAISIKWGWIVLLLGVLATIAAGALKGAPPVPQMAWGPPPPPPPPPYPGA